MDVSGGLSLVQSVVEKLASPIWTEIVSVLGVNSQLGKLKKTMSTVEDVLLDAEERERMHHGRIRSQHVEHGMLERLKEALYQADDLFDEVSILAHHKNLMPGNKLRKEVCLFFSRFNQLRFACTWSREIKDIRERLDDIINDYHNFPGDRPAVLVDRRGGNNPRETHSYVSPENDVIIGRDEDKRIVIGMLLDNTNVKENVSVVSVVGIGGLGKTTLAQLVYNDDKIQKEFPLRMWVCVSNDFNVNALAGKILEAATNQVNQSDDLDQLQKKLRDVLNRNKYLLVLDDVWTENYEEWERLKTLFGGGKGNRILVTTRSKKAAVVVGSCRTHELKGLSDDDSWDLFRRMTYPVQPQLADIGREIVGKCANVPLAIRVIGRLLQGQGKSRWENLKNTDYFSNMVQEENIGIIPVLKISYYDLPFHLKNCFSYCAIFPKDYKIIKEELISLWMAQGFIMPLVGESFEDTGEKYFEELLQRCFFQDVELVEGTIDEIRSCKMHDLIHDLAIEVAGTEILSSTYSTATQCVNEKTRHVSIDRNTPNDLVVTLTKMERMRTLLRIDYNVCLFIKTLNVEEVSKVKYLRVLGLNNLELTLPSVIGELVHLRYLDLSYNTSLCVLPSSITKLYNLQTLKFCQCVNLKSLPRDLRKLINLRHLDIFGCLSLTHMPAGMNGMTSLQKLTGFVVSGKGNGKYKGSASVGELGNLKNFTSHSDILDISVQAGLRDNTVEARERGFLVESQKLRKIRYCWKFDEGDDANLLLQSLQPHYNLRRLELWWYPGVRLPTWMMNLNTCLPNLVELQFRKCTRLERLPLMSQLRYLKVLILEDLHEVVYMESSSNTSGDDDELVFFPSLEKLKLKNMPKLKGWWKPESKSGKCETPKAAAMLSHLGIQDCPSLTTFPLCPELQELVLLCFNEALGPIMSETTHALSSSSSYTNALKNKQQEEGQGQGRLRKVERIDNVGYLNSLPVQSFCYLSHLEIYQDQKTERLRIGEVGEVFRSGRLSSLRSLHIYNCNKLKSISGRGLWERFNALETLALGYLDELDLEDENDVSNSSSESTVEECINEGSDAEMPWRYLAPTLRSLELSYLPKVVKLPNGIGCLSSLQYLSIMLCFNLESLPPSIGGLLSLQSLLILDCNKLKSMPEEMRHLTSLTELFIRGCSPELRNECKNKNSVNWSNIKHIPHKHIE